MSGFFLLKVTTVWNQWETTLLDRIIPVDRTNNCTLYTTRVQCTISIGLIIWSFKRGLDFLNLYWWSFSLKKGTFTCTYIFTNTCTCTCICGTQINLVDKTRWYTKTSNGCQGDVAIVCTCNTSPLNVTKCNA